MEPSKKSPIALVLRLETLALINGKGHALIAESAFPGWVPDFGADPAEFKNAKQPYGNHLERLLREPYGSEIEKWNNECPWLITRSAHAQLREGESANGQGAKNFWLDCEKTSISELETHVEAAEGKILPLMYCLRVDDRTWAVLPRMAPSPHQSFPDQEGARAWALRLLRSCAFFLQEELAEKGFGLDLDQDWRAYFETSTTQGPLASGRFFAPMAGYPNSSAEALLEARNLRESIKEPSAPNLKAKAL